MTLMKAHSTPIQQGAYPLIAGLGLGMLFHAPYQVFTRALVRKDMASGTSGFFLVRFTGATVGLVRSKMVPAVGAFLHWVVSRWCHLPESAFTDFTTWCRTFHDPGQPFAVACTKSRGVACAILINSRMFSSVPYRWRLCWFCSMGANRPYGQFVAPA